MGGGAHVENDAERPAVDFGPAVGLVVEQLGRGVQRAPAERGQQLRPPARAAVALQVVVGREACTTHDTTRLMTPFSSISMRNLCTQIMEILLELMVTRTGYKVNRAEKLKRTQVAELDVLARPVQQDVLELQVAVHHAALHAQHSAHAL